MAITGYTKLFSSIVSSTIWEASLATRVVFITLLALADKRGIIEGSAPGLATLARVSLAQCRQALACLEMPDPDSRSKTCEGRRIETVDGGWRLVNHAKYRAKMSLDERRAYQRVKQRTYRHRRQVSVRQALVKSIPLGNVSPMSQNDFNTITRITNGESSEPIHKSALPPTNARLLGVDKRAQIFTEVTHTDSDSDSDTDSEKRKITRARDARALLSDSGFEKFWHAYPRKIGKLAAKRVFARLKPTEALVEQLLTAITAHCQSEQWQENLGQYIPNPATWLNQGRWLDDPASAQQMAKDARDARMRAAVEADRALDAKYAAEEAKLGIR